MIREFRVPRSMKPDQGVGDALNALVSWRPDGLLTFLEGEELERCLALLPGRCPVVSLCHVPDMAGVVKVCGSFSALVGLAVSHLRQQGLRTLALLSLAEFDKAQEEAFLAVARPPAGYRPMFSEAVDSVLLDDPDCEVEPVSPGLASWLGSLPKPAGLLCPDLGGGGYVIRVCRALGIRVPEDVALVGTDDTDVSLSSRPTLTSVIPVGERIGAEAVRALARMMSGKNFEREVVRIEAMDLRIRQSTGLQRAEVCDIAGAVAHINQHACGGLTVGRLFRETQLVCYKTFHSHFTEATGQTPGQAILNRQIAEAQRLLAGTRLSVTMVAEKCGFGGGSDFARRFRLVTGVSPTEFRRRGARA